MLNVGQIITEVKESPVLGQLGSRLGILLDKFQTAINQTAQSAGVDSTGFMEPPNAPSALNIKVASNGEQVHATIHDSTDRSRTRNYFVEYATNPAFANSYIEHLGVGRHRVLNLPSKDDSNNTVSYYFRTYSMDPGSAKSSPSTNYGGTTPTAVTLNGSTKLTLLPSTGAGTAPTNGTRSGQGFGKNQFADEVTGK